MMKFSAALLACFCLLTLNAQEVAVFPYDIQKVVVADSAAVVSAHPLATRVGLSILRQGGNAVDAAVAVHFALAVVYPQAGNLGGGGFMIYRSAKGALEALDFRECAPARATADMYRDSSGRVLTQKSRFDVLAAAVPGSVDGMWEAHKKYGRMEWHRLLEPALELAEKGFQITQREADLLNREQLSFVRFNSILPAFVRMEQPWQAGDWLLQKDLATTLRWMMNGGRDEFYKGRTATLIVRDVERRGGLISHADLADYKSVWRKPLVFAFNGMQVVTMPPPSSGGLLLQQMLGMYQMLPAASYTAHTPKTIHAMSEIERRAFADRAEHMGDPDFWEVPGAALTDTAYLRRRLTDFDPERATPSSKVRAGAFPKREETTHYSIVDHAGNCVSVTTTLNDVYGCRTVASGTGILLNNEMDDFSAMPGVPNLYGALGGAANAIAPGKRPLSSMTPVIVMRDNKPLLVAGTPGGTTIPTTMFQVLLNAFVFGLTPEESVQAPRFHHQWQPDALFVEDGAFDPGVLEALEALGHSTTPREPIGRVEAIFIQERARKTAVADRRGDDSAGGY
jgi:gamma-glutamyltranspeptidase/glutathione hydrolase